MTDIWVCSTCHSVNRQRDNRCYKCGASQAQATGALEDLRLERAIHTRTVVRYRSSWLRALLAAGFIVAVAVLGIVLLVLSLDDLAYFRSEIPNLIQGLVDEEELARRVADSVVPGILQLTCSIFALLFFAAWLSRATMNVPALGGGTPNATPTKAFVYPFIPIVNLIKVPGMIQDVLYRLDPKAGGFFMLLIAWIGLVGSAIISLFVGTWVSLRINSIVDTSKTIDEAIAAIQGVYDIEVWLEVITTVMISIGAIVLVFVIFRIETRAFRRDREIRAAASAGVGLETRSVPDAQARSVAATGTFATASATGDGDAASAALDDSAPLAGPKPDPDLAIVGTTVSATSLGTSPTETAGIEPEPGPSAAAAGLSAAPGATVPAEAAPTPAPIVEPGVGRGPHLALEIGTDHKIRASIEGEPPEIITMAELREAAQALVRAGGTASLSALSDDDASTAMRVAVAEAMHAAGAPLSER